MPADQNRLTAPEYQTKISNLCGLLKGYELIALQEIGGREEISIAALRAAGGTKRQGRRGRSTRGNAKPVAGKRRKRAKITDATRAEVKKLAIAGKTSPEIAKTVGISEQSVFNVKKSLGLTRKRK